MRKSIFLLFIALTSLTYHAFAQGLKDTITQINKQKFGCLIKEITPENITYELISNESKTNFIVSIEQIESIKWADGKITYVNSNEGDIKNNVAKQAANMDSVFYAMGLEYNAKYNTDYLNLPTTVFYSTLFLSGAVTFTPCLIAYCIKPNPSKYHGPNQLVKKNQSFKEGYIYGAQILKKSTITTGWCIGTVMNLLSGLLIYQIITNR
jgi:hypothetical protein